MDRSRYLSILGISASLPLAQPEEETGPIGNDIYLDLVKVSEQAAVESLPKQQADGGLRDKHEILQPEATASFLLSLTAMFLAPQSGYYFGTEHPSQGVTFYLTDLNPLNETVQFAAL
jgi:hypothetical protein